MSAEIGVSLSSQTKIMYHNNAESDARVLSRQNLPKQPSKSVELIT